jgi:long-subunit fatty acid transport protein
MMSHPRLSLSLAAFAALAWSGTALAQDFFRDYGTSRSSGGIGPVVASEYTYQDATPSGLQPVTPPGDSEYQEKYNFALGPVRFSLAAGFGVEFNDNINLSEDHRESDVILRPSLNIDASWKISETNTLRLGLGLSYAKYLDHSENDTDGILISPTSELAYSFEVGAFKITLRDRGSYQEDTYDVPQLGNIARYRRAENQAGIQFDWAFNQNTNIVFGYDHYNLWTFDREFSDEERAIDTIFLKPEFQVSPTVKVGIVGAFSEINFRSSNRADGNNILVGPFVEWKATEFLTVYLEGGVQELNFDGTSSFDQEFFRNLTAEERTLFRDDEDSSSWYLKFQIDHRANDYFTQRLSGSKTAEIGIGTDFYDLYHIEYSADWTNFIANMQFGPTLFYEYYETSGPLGEQAHRFGAALGLRYNLTNSITLGLDYRFLFKNSNLEGLDYYQNLAFLSIYYKF